MLLSRRLMLDKNKELGSVISHLLIIIAMDIQAETSHVYEEGQ